LANTRARLETLFGDADRLQLLPAPGGGTVARIHLPLRRDDA
jgi:sensor histidine kinase YesM